MVQQTDTPPHPPPLRDIKVERSIINHTIINHQQSIIHHLVVASLKQVFHSRGADYRPGGCELNAVNR